MISFSPIVRPEVDLAGLRRPATRCVTVTVSETLPTPSSTLMSAVWPAESVMPLLLERLEALQLGDDVVAAERQEQRAIDALARW